MADNSIDSIVTDPPYGLSQTRPDKVADAITRWATGARDYTPGGKGFMGKTWDSFVPPPAVWDECMRVLKPGGHLLVFAGTRTQDLMGLSIRLAGFELRDSLAWIYGSGFPKSLNVGKATGDERWAGWGTVMKPAIEPVIVARKPIKGTVAANVLVHGTGGINVDGCRVGTTDKLKAGGALASLPGDTRSNSGQGMLRAGVANTYEQNAEGRFPPNVLLDPEAAAAMDEQGGVSKSAGGVSRFFPVFKYQAKTQAKERPSHTTEDGTEVKHPTVKPLELMRWLVRLVTPPDGIVLDPFAGSGTTLEAARMEGFTPVGIEAESDYIPLIEARLSRVEDTLEATL